MQPLQYPPLTKVSDPGEMHCFTSDKEKADCLNFYFASVSTINDSTASLPPFEEKTDKSTDDVIITEKKVKDILDILNVNKASGLDMISKRMLKYTSASISKPLEILFNRSIQEGVFPEIWKLAQVVPMYKKGEKSMPENYRPLSSLSNVGKGMERVVFKHIYIKSIIRQ